MTLKMARLSCRKVLELREKDAAAENSSSHAAGDQVRQSGACMPGARMPVTKDEEKHLGGHHHCEKNNPGQKPQLSSTYTHGRILLNSRMSMPH